MPTPVKVTPSTDRARIEHLEKWFAWYLAGEAALWEFLVPGAVRKDRAAAIRHGLLSNFDRYLNQHRVHLHRDRVHREFSRTSLREETVSPEDTLREAGISTKRQAKYQRRMSRLLAGRE